MAFHSGLSSGRVDCWFGKSEACSYFDIVVAQPLCACHPLAVSLSQFKSTDCECERDTSQSS